MQGGQQTTGTQTSTPWGPAQPHITGVLDQAKNMAGAGGRDYNVGGLMGIANDVISGKFLDPTKNPYIRGMIPQLQDNMMKQLMNTRDASQANGAFGGDRMQLARGQAVGGMNDTMARMYYDAYNKERGAQLNVGSILGQAQNLDWGPLMNYANIIGSTTGGYGTQTQTGQGPSGLSRGLQAAMAAAQLAALFS